MIGHPEGLLPLKRICEENPDLRAMAIEAIGKIGTKESLEYMTPYFTDEDPMVAFSCIDALGNIHLIESYNILVDIYEKIDEMGQGNLIDRLS
jgi:HEAT repeat protein